MGILVPFGYNNHSVIAVLAIRYFAFRKMLACGICKYYGSSMWRKFTAMKVHYFTQPLPNAVSFYVNHLPDEFHRFSVLMTFVIEILCPFLLYIPIPWVGSMCRYIAWIMFVGLLFMINLTGNYGPIGFLNFIENFSCLDDQFFLTILPFNYH